MFPDLPEKWRRVHQNALKGEVSSGDRDPYYRADGTVEWTRWECRPWYENDGAIGGIIVYTEVVTHHIHAEEALRTSEERFRSLFESMMAGSCIDEIVYDKGRAIDYRILDVNPSYERIMGIDRNKAVGALGSQLYGTGKAPWLDTFTRVAETGEPASFEAFFEPIQRYLEFTVSRPTEGRFSTVFTDITERKQVELERERLSKAIEQSGEIIVITDIDGEIQYVNPVFEQVTGYTPREVVGQNPRILKSGKQDEGFYRDLWETISDGGTWQGRFINKRKDGSLYTEEATISPVYDSNGDILNYVAVKRDITGQLRLENQYQQAQKMESVGRLAGGVAHDFNNMLSVISGNAELALSEIDASDPIYAEIIEIQNAARRSADLTRQLLAFARKQTVSPKILDVNETIESMLKILARLIGEDIDLLWRPGTPIKPIRIDPAQIDQLLANLLINARDAIGHGVGKVTIETAPAAFDEEYCTSHAGFVPGHYVLLAVSDDGCGMDEATTADIFEPFFTTKSQGEGTGLGLATVYGIVKQNNGFINVYSEPGHGTTFKIYLPVYAVHKFEPAEKVDANHPYRSGQGTVLLVEDEPAILTMGKKMLERLGYTVLAASTPGEAIHMAEEHNGRIDLLMTDVVMPEMNGRDLAKRILSIYPEIRRLFTSGYTANVIAHHGVLDEGVNFIQKPFSLRALSEKVREILDHRNHP